MDMRVKEALWALTEKEKQTLRLMVRGHDAKSIARSLDLSVHTINERLRDARRKLAVSSSREAARLLLEVEGDGSAPIPEMSADKTIGEDADRASADGEADVVRQHRDAGRHLGQFFGCAGRFGVLVVDPRGGARRRRQPVQRDRERASHTRSGSARWASR